MSTIDITYGEQTNIQFDIPVLSKYMELKLNALKVIYGLLKGTDSDSWLVKAEKLNG